MNEADVIVTGVVQPAGGKSKHLHKLPWRFEQ
jgi:hypothetical protein